MRGSLRRCSELAAHTVSNTSINGRFALRGCVLNYRTTREDMQTLLDDVRGAADTVTNAPEPP